MINRSKVQLAYHCFLAVGVYVLSLALFALASGAETFMGLIAVLFFFFIPSLIAILAVLAVGIFYGLQAKTQAWPLFVVTLLSIPYTILAMDNIFYFYRPWIISTDAIVFISIAYGALCLAVYLIRRL
jgi:hypothetical protein